MKGSKSGLRRIDLTDMCQIKQNKTYMGKAKLYQMWYSSQRYHTPTIWRSGAGLFITRPSLCTGPFYSALYMAATSMLAAWVQGIEAEKMADG